MSIQALRLTRATEPVFRGVTVWLAASADAGSVAVAGEMR